MVVYNQENLIKYSRDVAKLLSDLADNYEMDDPSQIGDLFDKRLDIKQDLKVQLYILLDIFSVMKVFPTSIEIRELLSLELKVLQARLKLDPIDLYWFSAGGTDE